MDEKLSFFTNQHTIIDGAISSQQASRDRAGERERESLDGASVVVEAAIEP